MTQNTPVGTGRAKEKQTGAHSGNPAFGHYQGRIQNRVKRTISRVQSIGNEFRLWRICARTFCENRYARYVTEHILGQTAPAVL